MKGIILAAGRGRRMGRLTTNNPKCLINICGRTLLERQKENFNKVGINEIGIVTGYKREMLISDQTKEFFNPRWETTQMFTSLMCADEWLTKYPSIVSYSDIFYSHSLLKELVMNEDEISLTYDPSWKTLWEKRFSNPLDDAETFKLSKYSFIEEIGNKPKSIDDIDGQYMGLLKFTPKVWEIIKKSLREKNEKFIEKLHITELLNNLVNFENIKIKAIPNKFNWGELDTPKDLELYQSLGKTFFL